jgi:predicted transcriptional regulator
MRTCTIDYVPAAKKEPREAVTVRLSPAGLAKVDELADVEDRTRSDMIRILVGEALAARGVHGELRKAKR